MILGAGVTAWLVATALARQLKGHGIGIEVVGARAGNARRVLNTSPAASKFHRRIGIDDRTLLQDGSGAYSLGTLYSDWSAPRHRYFHAFTPPGRMLHAVEFHHFANYLRHRGIHTAYDSYSTAAHAAKLGRFAAPGSGQPPLACGMQLNAAAYEACLRAQAETLGVRYTDSAVASAAVCSRSGHVEHLVLETGEKTPADFVFDCGNELSPLMRDTLGVGVTDWSNWLPSDRAVVAIETHRDETPVCRSLIRTANGWITRESPPGIHRHALHYSSALTREEAAVAELVDVTGIGEAAEVATHRLPKPGCLERFWQGNCLALGNAAGCSGDFVVSGLHLAQSGVLRWLELFPDRDCDPLLAAEYNRAFREETQRVRDVHWLHVSIAHRESPFWSAAGAVDTPESLQYRLDTFGHTGVLPAYEADSVSHEAWVSLLIGMDLWPERWDPLAEHYEFEAVDSELRDIAVAAESAAGAMPGHDETLRRVGRQGYRVCGFRTRR